MAVLTASGIEFTATDTLTSTYAIYPLNSVAVFYQANAPTGWTKSTAHNDKALRCVSGVGGGSGGTNAFTSSFPNTTIPVSGTAPVTGSVGNTTLTTPQLAVHAHPNGFGGAGRHGWQSGGEGLTGTGNNGAGGAHAHPWSGSGPFSFSFDVRVQYVDAIICTRTS